jgi:rare lipoprotein A
MMILNFNLGLRQRRTTVCRLGAGIYRRVLMLGVAAVLAIGCSSEPILSSGDEVVVVPTTDTKARYNRAYKVKGKTYVPMRSAVGYKAQGIASWYGGESGNRTASGERFHPHGLTAAHKTLPIPCTVRVTNLRNGRHVDVLINDRGPFEGNRLIDLSKGAAEKVGLRGLAEVTVEYLG